MAFGRQGLSALWQCHSTGRAGMRRARGSGPGSAHKAGSMGPRLHRHVPSDDPSALGEPPSYFTGQESRLKVTGSPVPTLPSQERTLRVNTASHRQPMCQTQGSLAIQKHRGHFTSLCSPKPGRRSAILPSTGAGGPVSPANTAKTHTPWGPEYVILWPGQTAPSILCGSLPSWPSLCFPT